MRYSDILFSTRGIKMVARGLFLLMLVPINSYAFDLPGADQIPFHHLSVEDGLSQVTVNDIAQDEQGFLWFATEDGLNRYDGKSFVHYRTDADEEHQISGNIINFVFNDSKNRLWIGTNGQGVDLKTNNSFKALSVIKNGQSRNNIIATVLFEDSKNNLWLGTWSDGLFKFNEKTREFIHSDSNQLYVRVWTISEFNNQILVGVKDNGIALLTNGKLQPWSFAENLKSVTVKSLYVTDGDLWIGTDGQGLWKIRIASTELWKITDVPNLINSAVHKIYSDQFGVLWIGTAGDGVFRKDKNSIWINQTTGNQAESLSNNRVWSLFQDKTGVFWVGTEGAGLNYYDPYSIIFRNIRQGNNFQKNLNDKMVYAISADDEDNWWFGTESGGVNHWDSKKNQFNYYTVESGHLFHNTVRALLPTNKGMIVGTLDGFSLISKTGQFIGSWNTENLPELSNSNILSLEKSTEEKIWIGTYNGLFLFDMKSANIIASFLDNEKNEPFVLSAILTLLQNQDELWIGTYNDGLHIFNKSKKTWKHFSEISKQSGLIGNKAIYSIFKSAKEAFWIGTKGAGILEWVEDEKVFSQMDKQAGLANNVAYGIMEDANNNIWLSSNAGLSRYNPQTKQINNFYPSDGIQGREFNLGAYHHLSNVMAFGGINGVTWFDDSTELRNPYFPQTQITDVRIFNKYSSQFNEHGITLKKRQGLPEFLSLNYDKTMFTIEFAALHFSAPQKNSFRYRLLGLDDNWIDSIGSQSEATFTGLSPGSYQFQVIAISRDGLSGKSPAILDIILLPPPWKSWWAYSLYVLISLLILWRYLAFLKRKLAIQKNLNAGLHKIDQLKERLGETEKMAVLGELSSNVAHSLRNPLASIRTSAELLEDDVSLPTHAKEDAENIISEVDRLSRWIKELLAYSKNQDSNMKPMNIVDSCKTILDQYQQKFLTQQIKNKFSSTIKEVFISMDPILFQHMLHSLLDNAIEAIENEGTITLKIESVEGEKIQLAITDTGSGISFSQQTQIFDASFSTKTHGLGMGLSLVKRIVERHDANISVTSEANKGTCFMITFNRLQE